MVEVAGFSQTFEMHSGNPSIPALPLGPYKSLTARFIFNVTLISSELFYTMVSFPLRFRIIKG